MKPCVTFLIVCEYIYAFIRKTISLNNSKQVFGDSDVYLKRTLEGISGSILTNNTSF